MREIKFRAWDDEQKKFWYGDLKSNNNFNQSMTLNYFFEENYDLPIMQFTELKDKNSVEIYEGDLLRPYYDDNEIVEVIWHEETASYRAASYLNNCHGGCFAELLFLDDVNDIEVIGNVYENPELLQPEHKGE